MIFLLVNLFCTIILATPEWLNNHLGKDHKVPPPFETVRVTDKSVSIWGRTITLNDAALPENIINQQKEMLTDSISLVYESEKDKPVQLKPVSGSLKLLESYDDYAVFSGMASSKGVSAKIRNEIWFDGFSRITLAVEGDSQLKVKRLSLIADFNPECIGPHYRSQYIGHSLDTVRATWGQITTPKDFEFGDFLQLTGRNQGFSFLAECPVNWYIQRKNQVYQVIPTEEGFRFRVNFIDAFRKIKIGKRMLDFAFVFGPTRPPRKDWRQYAAFWWQPVPTIPGQVSKNDIKPMMISWPFSQSGSEYINKSDEYKRVSRKIYCLPIPDNPEGFKEWSAIVRNQNGLHTPYINADDFDPSFEDGRQYKDEWAGEPLRNFSVGKGTGFAPEFGVGICYYSESWADYFIWNAIKLLKEFDFDGYYIDNCSARVCTNPKHPDSHKPYIDELGQSWERKPLFSARKLFMRLYKAIKQTKPEAITYVNGSTYHFFWDFQLSAEYLNAFSQKHMWPEFINQGDPEGGFLSGYPLGPMKMILPNDGIVSPQRTRALIALTVIGDSVVAWEHVTDLNVYAAFDKIKGDFRIWEAKYIPYYNLKGMIGVSDQDIIPTLYQKKDIALLFLSRPWKSNSAETQVTFSMDKIFNDSQATAPVITDAETGEKFKVSSFMNLEKTIYSVDIKVNGNDYRVLKIQ